MIDFWEVRCVDLMTNVLISAGRIKSSPHVSPISRHLRPQQSVLPHHTITLTLHIHRTHKRNLSMRRTHPPTCRSRSRPKSRLNPLTTATQWAEQTFSLTVCLRYLDRRSLDLS